MQFTAALLACPALLAFASTAGAFQTSTTRASVGTSGVQGNYDSSTPSISADGRFVAFLSNATNLVPGDAGYFIDVFLRDRVAGTTELISVATGGAQANAANDAPRISADGRFIVFVSDATNLVPGDTNTTTDIFVRDRINGTTERVSLTMAGAQGNGISLVPSISADGRFVAFESGCTNLGPGDTNMLNDVYVRDRTGGTTERVSVSTSGSQGDGVSGNPSISADGRFVAFGSLATNLVTGDTNGANDIFVHDRVSGVTERVNVGPTGLQGNSHSYGASISADGRFVAFVSTATNLVAGDTNGVRDIFVRDRQTATTERVSVNSAGTQGDSYSETTPSISGDGRTVAFVSYATNLIVGDTNATADVFLRDRYTGTIERASVDSNGVQANNACVQPVLSIDGRFVVFTTLASNLVPGDTNGNYDAFVRDRGPLTPTVYCSAGTTSNGCSASIAVNANPSVTFAVACNISVTSVEGQKSGILFYGIDNSSFAPAPWASGSTSYLCVKQPTQRTPVQNSGGTFGACNGSFVLDWNAYQSTHALALGNPWSFGAKVYVQAWFRDPLAVKATNLSNALELTYVP